jgi:hypothetical protein
MRSAQNYLLGALLAGMLTLAARPACADDRRGDLDVFGLVAYDSSGSARLSRYPDVQFDPENAVIGGAGAAYHFTPHWSVLLDLAGGQSNVRLTELGASNVPPIRQSINYVNGRFNIEFTPLSGVLSPVVSAGVGLSNLKTAIPGASPQRQCSPAVFAAYWWCATGVPTFGETGFAYNAGLGARLDLEHIFFKLMLGARLTRYDGISGIRRVDEVTLQVGARLRRH